MHNIGFIGKFKHVSLSQNKEFTLDGAVQPLIQVKIKMCLGPIFSLR
jgi:hypothetical protein